MNQYLILLAIVFFVSDVHCSKNFVLVSAPGSGKGTFSQSLIKKYGYLQICPGDIFRSEIESQTELGKKIQPIVEKGEYVDESIVCSLVIERLSGCLKNNKNFIIDGFPRSDFSFQCLHNFLKENKLVENTCFLQFSATDDVCLNRILNRLVCSGCSVVYNTLYAPPREHNTCDACGSLLVKRKADTKDIVETRLKFFHSKIEPIIDMAGKFYKVKKIDTDISLEALEKLYGNLVEKGLLSPPVNWVDHKNLHLNLYLDFIKYNTEEKLGILPYILENPDGTYLDVGTGGDAIAALLSKIPDSMSPTIIASDVDEKILNILPARHPQLNKYLGPHFAGPQLKLQQVDATSMKSFSDNSLDGINASSVVHEIVSYAGGIDAFIKFISESFRVLKKDGILTYRDPEAVSQKNEIVYANLKTSSIKLFTHIFLTKFLTDLCCNHSSQCQKYHAYDSSDLMFTCYKKNEIAANTFSYKEYLGLRSHEIDFSRQYIVQMPRGLCREIERHYLTYLHQCNPLMFVQCLPSINLNVYFVNYLAHSTASVLDNFLSNTGLTLINGTIDIGAKKVLDQSITDILQVLEYGILLHFDSRYKERQLHGLLKKYGFNPSLYIVQVREGECLLDYRIFGLLYDRIREIIFDDHNGPVNKQDVVHAEWLYREGGETYIYFSDDQLITKVAEISLSQWDNKGECLILCPVSASQNKFIPRLCYDVILKNSLDISDELGYPVEIKEGKRLIHFRKMTVFQAFKIYESIIKQSPGEYEYLQKFLNSEQFNQALVACRS